MEVRAEPRGPGSGSGAIAGRGYAETRDRLETYFDRTAAETWARLTSDAPVSRIRATVRAGRASMRAELLSRLPDDLTGMRVLDAGCGPGDVCVALARRGAEVVGVDLSASLLDVARERMPRDVAGRIDLRAGDMTDPAHGCVRRRDRDGQPDPLPHAGPRGALGACAPGSGGSTSRWRRRRRSSRSCTWREGVPALRPLADDRAAVGAPAARGAAHGGTLTGGRTVASGFYISRAMELS